MHVDGEQFQREDVHLFHDGINERAAAFDDAEAAGFNRAVWIGIAMFLSGDDEHLVRADLGVAAEHDGDADDNGDRDHHDHDGDDSAGEDGLGKHGDWIHRVLVGCRVLIFNNCQAAST